MKDGRSPYRIAESYGYEEAMKTILSLGGADQVNGRDRESSDDDASAGGNDDYYARAGGVDDDDDY